MKQCYCLLERFNNYFNRKIIKYDNVSDYEDHSQGSFIPYNTDGSMTRFDFNPNDNVMTEIIVNNVPFDPDYFLLLDEEANIVQRWFVLEQKRNRQGQWIYTLRRDVVADNLENLWNAPIFVEKGMLKEDDPFILNSEGMSFNQVKKEEQFLQDKSGTSWIICYLAKSLSASNVKVDIASEERPAEFYNLGVIAGELGIPESVLASALNINPSDTNKLTLTDKLNMDYVYKQGPLSFYRYLFDLKPDFSDAYNIQPPSPFWVISDFLFEGSSQKINSTRDTFIDKIKESKFDLTDEMPVFLNRSYYLPSNQAKQVLDKYNGKIILYLGVYYTLNVSSIGTNSNQVRFYPKNYPIWNKVCEDTADLNSGVTYNENDGAPILTLDETDYQLSMTVYTESNDSYECTISSSRKICNEQEFDIIAMPVEDIYLRRSDFFVKNKLGISQRFASALGIKEGTNIYDIQLLPYCPLIDLFSEGELDVSNLTEHVDYDLITYLDENNLSIPVGIVLYVQSASFVNIVGEIHTPLYLRDSMKVDAECDFYRIVSPNYQGSFEFNVAKNGGSVKYFKAYCTYKPYTPFIKVSPDLKYLYGYDYNDNRGLICGGDFSLPRASSAWQQYQLENKNYQNIFNREIQNMSFMQSIEMRNQLISGAVGVLSDVAKGAAAGAYIGGGPAGAVIGGALGAGASAVGYAIDIDTLARTQRETKQLAIDKFNYHLGNVKALPYTLTKVGAFDISSKIYPILEYYTCTDKEKDALKNKIRYESMTVMRIGTIKEFAEYNEELNYFKGSLIRNDEISDDPHILNAIYEELLKGVYI